MAILEITSALLEILRWIWPFIVSAIMIILIDYFRKPRIEIRYKDEPISKDPRRWVHVFVVNKPLQIISRYTAMECRGKVVYTHLQTGETKGPFENKWASRVNPIRVELDSSNRPVVLVDETLIQQAKVENIPPGAERGLDIAVKFNGENEAYIWTPESYYNRKNPKYELKQGEYRVKVRIEAPGLCPVEKTFILENRGNKASGLRLREA
jgi:hypothetical protein